jgi:hypothetical protein
MNAPALWTPTSKSPQGQANLLLEALSAMDQSKGISLQADPRPFVTTVIEYRRHTLHMKAGLVASAYLTAMHSAASVQSLSLGDTPIQVVRVTELLGHRNMNYLYRHAANIEGFPNQHITDLANYLLGTTLLYWAEIYDEIQSSWPDGHRLGAFSSIRLPELDLLARRDKRMMKKYGNKQVEKIFEQQLALIVQSLGLYVISTRAGERTVDLICISADPTVRLTFLLEAKTTQRPYNLPRDDARALIEYVQEIRRALTTLPPLEFVLIVGPVASSTLAAKLQRLEVELGLPVRFCSAEDIAQLRELIAGPLPLNDMAERVRMGPWVLPSTFVEDIHKRHQQLRDSHEAFVKAMLAVRGFSNSPM